MLESLPDRPLTRTEAERLQTNGTGFVPLSVLKNDESPYVVYTMAVYQADVGVVYLLGYSDRQSAWVVIEKFAEDKWSVEKQENVIIQWTDEQYGDDFKQGMLDDEANEIEIGF